jgi:hypothetical protein
MRSSPNLANKRKFSIKDEGKEELSAEMLRLSSPPHLYHDQERRGSLASTASNHTLANSPRKLRTPSLQNGGIPIMAKRALSVPALNLTQPTRALSDFTPSEPTPYSPSPLTALLNTPPTPHSTALANRLPPVSALIQEVGSRERAVALLGKRMDIMEGEKEHEAETETETETAEKTDTVELRVKRLELEEAEAALEVAMQRHVVARNKAAVARAEMEDKGVEGVTRGVRARSVER